MDNKFTDNDIIKALECHISPVHCNGRQYYSVKVECSRELIENTLDLINRQKAEIERMQEEKARLHQLIPKMIKEAKAEAVKELIESLEDERYILPYAGQDRVVVFEDDIKKIAKEMTEEK